MDIEKLLLFVFGGLGIFLFGINLMGDNLKKIAGSKLKGFLEKYTNTPLKGIFMGIIVTGIIQSSSGTTALVVGLVRAGLLTLPQAVGVVLGANIGTTITSILIGLNIAKYALVFVAVGSIIMFFSSKDRTKSIGGVILGFGLIFYGLDLMGGELKELTKLESFTNILVTVSDIPILGFLVGVVLTAVVQSSSATIGILQSVYATGAFPLIGAIAIVLGDNVGTTITALMAAMGANADAKRTAFLHSTFKIIGGIIFMILLIPFARVVEWFGVNVIGDISSKLVISFVHITFNIVNVFMMYWFIDKFVWLSRKVIKDDNELQVNVELDEELIYDLPAIALDYANDAINNMGEISMQMYKYMVDFTRNNDEKVYDTGVKCEDLLDSLDKKIHDYLVKISQQDITKEVSQGIAKSIDTIRDFERIGDHLNNILDFFKGRYDIKISFSEQGRQDMDELLSYIETSFVDTLIALKTHNKELAIAVNAREENIDELCKKCRKRHIQRMADRGSSVTEDGFIVDILSNLERIGDHLNNIVVNLLQDNYDHEEIYQ